MKEDLISIIKKAETIKNILTFVQDDLIDWDDIKSEIEEMKILIEIESRK